ncbi:GNAT superfamily N-acetyltransferase [Kibdelosporangium banguiense]|uniref:GNAT superfamily N-acetyltransferase n=1 Tax=Kibdelosporangium banguiense TaxID=1365924 RepID=A0ABS4T5I7_9PSEU|nr:GNAT family N-acetyltransferase [Kibdelosporangium banguiense]MBP2319724.1 GNAT superfamily N-acetyltransferase [Kibdelosporangium banguiense]
MRIRTGDESDLTAVLALLDEATAWMVSRGNTRQWGTEPWSDQPKKVDRTRELITTGELWITELDGAPVGAMIVSDQPMPYVKPVDEPELYVRMLVTSRRHAGKRIGEQLLAKARSEAVAKGVSLMRVDCFAGGAGELVRYYERNGFQRAGTFTSIQDWPGQVLSMRL